MIGGSPAPSPDFIPSFSSSSSSSSSPSKMPVDFSPPLIAMVVIIATAFVLITYSRVIYRRILLLRRRYRRWRRRRRLVRSYVPSSVSGGDIESPSPPSYTDAFQLFSPYGLDESSIKTIPLTIYNRKSSDHECAVCLLEFDETDFVRTLPVCSHAFHVDCIDIWLRSHANCPLCRTGIFKPDSPFTPIMADRIRPSFDDMIIENSILETLNETQPESESTECEITQENSNSNSNSNSPRRNRDFLLKRSYSFGFERNLGSERLILETATVSPYRFRRSGGFWSKRPSPFTSMTKPRVFSFRYYRGMKSPFFRRRGSFFPLSESSVRYSGPGGGGGSSRRSKSFASPLSVGVFSSSRLRSGDPEALLSPERYNRR